MLTIYSIQVAHLMYTSQQVTQLRSKFVKEYRALQRIQITTKKNNNSLLTFDQTLIAEIKVNYKLKISFANFSCNSNMHL